MVGNRKLGITNARGLRFEYMISTHSRSIISPGRVWIDVLDLLGVYKSIYEASIRSDFFLLALVKGMKMMCYNHTKLVYNRYYEWKIDGIVYLRYPSFSGSILVYRC